MTGGTTTMLTAIGSALTEMITWLGSVVTAIAGTDGALKDLLPLFALGVAGTVVMFGCKTIKMFTWGA